MRQTERTPNTAAAHWDSIYGRAPSPEPGPEAWELEAVTHAEEFFGGVAGKTVLDLGCGTGATSRYFADRGAKVVAVDASPVAIQSLQEWCVASNAAIIPICARAQQLDLVLKGHSIDCVFGSMILHHIEPFDQFAADFAAVLPSGKRAFFYENNAVPILTWCRDNLVGRWWIPKLGDPDEAPLSSAEIAELKKHFLVRQHYPEMYFLRLASTYLAKQRFMALTSAVDRWLYRRRIMVNYSYRQYVYLEKP